MPENNDKENIKYRRFSFYKRNGFLLTSLIMSFKNVDYLSLVNRELNDNEFKNYVIYFYITDALVKLTQIFCLYE